MYLFASLHISPSCFSNSSSRFPCSVCFSNILSILVANFCTDNVRSLICLTVFSRDNILAFCRRSSSFSPSLNSICSCLVTYSSFLCCSFLVAHLFSILTFWSCTYLHFLLLFLDFVSSFCYNFHKVFQ